MRADTTIAGHARSNHLEPLLLVLALLATTCMFLLGRHWQWMRQHEGPQWILLCLVVSAPIWMCAIRIANLREARIGVPLVFLGVFGCVCMDPLKYYLSGERLRAPLGFSEPSPEAFAEVGLLTSLFCLAVVSAARIPLFGRSRPSAIDRIRGPVSPGQATIWATILMLIGMAPFLLLGEEDSSFGALLQTMAAGRSRTNYLQFETTGLGSSNALILFLGNGLVLCGLIATYALLALPRTLFTTIVLSVELAVSFLMIASGGGRTRVGFLVLVAAVFCGILAVRRRSKALLLGVLLVLSLTSLVWVLQYRYRYVGWSAMSEERNDLPSSAMSNDLAAELALIVDTYPHVHDFYCGSSPLERAVRPIPDLAVSFVTSPIPRAWWPGKPVDPSWQSYNYLRMGIDGSRVGTNITPTVIGRAYMKYGVFGVVELALLIGLACHWIDRTIQKNHQIGFPALIACCLAYYLCASARDLVPGLTYPVVLLALTGMAIDFHTRCRRGSPRIVVPTNVARAPTYPSR